jgi:hypothetical protein
MNGTCFTCKHWSPIDPAERTPEKSLGACKFSPVLPWSMRYCNSKVAKMPTFGEQGGECRVYVPRET